MVGSIYVQIARTSRSHATSGLTLAGKDTSYDRSREDTSRRVVRRACANRGDERTSNRQSHRTHTPRPSDVTSHPTSPCTTGRARPRVRRLRPDRFEKNKSTSRKARKGALTFRTLLCPPKSELSHFLPTKAPCCRTKRFLNCAFVREKGKSKKKVRFKLILPNSSPCEPLSHFDYLL